MDGTTHSNIDQPGAKSSLTPDETVRPLRLYRQMVKIRLFEEQVNDLYRSARMPGLAHLYIGEEGVAVGICEALRKDDLITSTHRGHGHCLAKGGSPDLMFAELLGRRNGYCRGKGGSMHIADQQSGNLGANAIVGGSAGIATGAALSAKMRGTKQVAVCFFGEGALGQGLLYEVMNMASLWCLPVIYVCENNLYNEYTHYRETTAGEILDRPRAFGIHAEAANGQDVEQVHSAACRLVQRSRDGLGPAFLQCDTYRFHGHYVGDVDRAYYRSKEEESEWMSKRDPIILLGDRLIDKGIVDQGSLDEIREAVQREIAAGLDYALNCPYPAESEVDENVYS